jgi:hypothetical protein
MKRRIATEPATVDPNPYIPESTGDLFTACQAVFCPAIFTAIKDADKHRSRLIESHLQADEAAGKTKVQEKVRRR